MTEAIVNYLNLKLETVGRLGVIHCLAELRSDGTTTVPYVYSGTGQVVPINIDGGNLSYWRKESPSSSETIVGKYGVNQKSKTFNFRLVVIARRKDSTVDDAFMPTRLSDDIENLLTGSFPDLKLLLKAQSVNIRVSYTDTDTTKVWNEEFKATQVNDLSYTRVIMAFGVAVTVVASNECWQNECDIDPNILHIFDFCNPNVVAELTPTQVACLEDALCEPCADVTIDINGVPFDTVPSGGTLDIPVLDTGSNPVGSQIGTDWVIGNNATYINSVQVTDQAAEQDAIIAVELDGNPSGTWNAGTQTWEVTSDPCLDGNIELNGVPVATVASGGTEDIPVLSEGSNPVGSLVGLDWVIENNATTINGVQVTDQEAEQDAAIFVTRDGVQNGTWNAGTQTWEVVSQSAILQRNATQIKTIAGGATFNLKTKLDGTANNGTWDGIDTLDFTSAACSPVTFQINAVNKESLSSGSTFNLITKLDGAVNSGSYDAPTDTLSFTSAACSPVALQINGTPQESIAAGATFNLIATLDGVAGGTYTPATDTLAFTSTGGWVRPSFWPTLPTLTAASQAGYILLPVYENRLNRFTCQILNNAAIDWGDGTTSAPTAAIRTKTYTYSALSGTVYVDALTGENYKFVTIGITASGGNIVYVDFAVSAATSPVNAANYALDWNLSFPFASTFHMGALFTRNTSFAQQIKLWAVGSNCYLRFGKSYNLQSLQLPAIMVLSQPSMASNIGACRVGNLDYSTTTNIQNNFSNSRILSHGNLIANGTVTAYYLTDAYNCESVGTVTCNSVVGLGFNMFANMYSLRSIGLITMPLATDLTQMFFACENLTAIRFANSAACTVTTQMITACTSLQVLDMPNLTRGVNFTGTSMGNYGMNIFANGIGTASGAQTITITGTPFGALVTAGDATALAIRLVMTGKGYTIAN